MLAFLRSIFTWEIAGRISVILILLAIPTYLVSKIRTWRKNRIETIKSALYKCSGAPLSPDDKAEYKFEDETGDYGKSESGYYGFTRMLFEVNEVDKKYAPINRDYFIKNLPEFATIFESDKDEEYYHFPLYTRSNWLRSNNENFEIELEPLNLDEADAKKAAARAEEERKVGCLERIIGKRFSDFLVSRGKNVWYGDSYHITDIRNTGKGVSLTAKLSTYQEFLDTSEFLRSKAKLMFTKYHRAPFRRINNEHRIERAELMGELQALLSDPQAQTGLPFGTAVGVNVFTAFATDDGYKIALHKRSNKVFEYPNIFHICPGGSFQPLNCFSTTLINQQYSLEYTVLREFYEEMFNLEEAKTDLTADPFDIFKRNPAINLLSDADIAQLREGKFTGNDKLQIRFTSLLIDAASMKIEVTAALLITDKDFNRDIRQKIKANDEGKIGLMDMGSEELCNIITDYMNVNNFLPSGAVALVEGMKWVKEQ